MYGGLRSFWIPEVSASVDFRRFSMLWYKKKPEENRMLPVRGTCLWSPEKKEEL